LPSRYGRLEEAAATVAIFSLGDKTLRLKQREVNPKSGPKQFVKLDAANV